MLQLRNVALDGHPGRWDVSCHDHQITTVERHQPQQLLPGENLDGALLVRSFVDPHMHLDKAYLSAKSPNHSGTLAEAIELSRRAKKRETFADTYKRIMRGAVTALTNGTTRLRTHVDVDPVAGLTGVRAAIQARDALAGRPSMQIVAFPQEGLGDGVEDLLRDSLKLGCDAIGGIPAHDDEPTRHIQRIFAIAESFNVPVDMHIDESDDPSNLTLDALADETIRRGWTGRVTAGHCCSLAAQPPTTRARIIDKVAKAGIHVVTLPSTNLYLQGRHDDRRPRRGLTPVTELLRAGVNVAYGSDNIQDPFNPFGNASMLETGLLLAHAAHMGGTQQLDDVFDMATCRPTALMDNRQPSEARSHAVVAGAPANLLAIEAASPADAIIRQRPPVSVIADGQIVVRRHETVHLSGPL